MSAKIETDTIGMLLTDVSRLLRGAFDRRINASRLGLTPGEARALLQAATTVGIKQADIALRMGIEPMTLSVYLDRLESLGLVARVPDASDRRAKNIVLTQQADAVLVDLQAEMHALMAGVTEGLDAGARETLRAGLRILKDNLQNPRRCPSPGEAGPANG